MTDEDQYLILESKKGQVKAFRKLVERYKKSAFFIALGLADNREDAYDLSQEAYIRVVYKSQKQYRSGQKKIWNLSAIMLFIYSIVILLWMIFD